MKASPTRPNAPKKQQERQHEGDGHHHSEAFHRALLILEFAAPHQLIAGRQVPKGAMNTAARLSDEAAHVATAYVHAYADVTLSGFAGDRRAAAVECDARDGSEGDERAVVGDNSEPADGSGVAACCVWVSQRDVEAAFAFPQRGDG